MLLLGEYAWPLLSGDSARLIVGSAQRDVFWFPARDFFVGVELLLPGGVHKQSGCAVTGSTRMDDDFFVLQREMKRTKKYGVERCPSELVSWRI